MAMADRETEAQRVYQSWADDDGPTWLDRKATEDPRRFAIGFGAAAAVICSPIALAATIQGHWGLAAVLWPIAIVAGAIVGVMARKRADLVARAMELWREEHPEDERHDTQAGETGDPTRTAGETGETGETDGSQPVA
jgi:hypothetical protein